MKTAMMKLMNAATPAANARNACLVHGLLAPGAKECTCGRSSYSLDDEGDRATLQAYVRTSVKARCRNLAIVGFVAGALVESMLAFGATGALTFGIGPSCIAGAALGVVLGWFARPFALHKLDAALDA